MKYSYNHEFQKQFLKFLIQKNKCDIINRINEELFDSFELKTIFLTLKEWVKHHNEVPSYKLLAHKSGGVYTDEAVHVPESKQKIVAAIKEIAEEQIKIDEIKSVLSDFITAQEMRKLYVRMAQDIELGKYDIDQYQTELNKLKNQLQHIEHNTPKESLRERIMQICNPKIEYSTGYDKLDYFTKGIKPASYWTIGGSTSSGKTMLALNIAYNLAKKGLNVTYFSTELIEEQLMTRLAIMKSGVNIYLKRYLTPSDQESFYKGIDIIESMPIDIQYTQSLETIGRTLLRKKSILYIVDYLQQIIPGRYRDNEVTELKHITREIAKYSKDLRICIIALSQLSRQGALNPNLHSFRGSGYIEEHTNIGIILKTKKPSNDKVVKMSVAVEKNGLFGLTGDIEMSFNKQNLRIRETGEYNND